LIKMVTQINVKKNGTQIHVNRQVSQAKANTATTSNDELSWESAH